MIGQEKIIEDIDYEVNQATLDITTIMAKLTKLLGTSDKGKLCFILVLFILILVLMFVLVMG